ncbi:hypothetical protein F383_37247 [Gossypium arboreum]|uniref:Uncharacterized protein n=1 Tax=Gossypium arboreum TaxID=29729 RepID=A0A0B0MEU5_GOSAR|nr:hypothetical protein F383_37247 [Gossypium arboreum]
MHLVQSFSQI